MNNGKILFLCLAVAFCGMVVIDVLDTALKWELLPWHVVKAQADSANKIVDKTYDPDRAMSIYTWFKQTKADIEATEKNIDAMKTDLDRFKADNGEMKSWDYQTKEIYEQKNVAYLGQIAYYNNKIADYSAASEDATKNIYLKDLPAKIDKKVWT